jgi:hypothetical protein
MRPRRRTLAAVAVAALLAAALLVAVALGGRTLRGAGAPGGEPAVPALEQASNAGDAAAAWELPLPTGAEGWEEAAETVLLDLRRFALGRPAAGAYEEARAEAARRDLALYPPAPARLRRLLLAPSPGDRSLALAALAARGEAEDELVAAALRSARTDDDEVLRLLTAELVSALPAEQLARHEDELLRAFEREQNPLVLAVALPALERLEVPRLRALLQAQLSLASPEMIPVLAALARDRLGPEGLREVGISVFSPREGDGAASR